MAGSDGTIGSWNITTLTRFIRDSFDRNPPRFLPAIEAEDIYALSSLIVKGGAKVSFPLSGFTVGTVGAPGFQNTWTNFNTATNAAAAFYKDAFGFVHLTGRITAGTVGSPAFTLVPGYWPSRQLLFAVTSNAAFGQVTVETDGRVIPASPSSNTSVSLDGIVFKAA